MLRSRLTGSPVRIIGSVLIATLVSHASWAECRYSADRTSEADAAGIRTVVIGAGAGDLAVHGSTATTRVRAKGRACANSEESLAAIKIEIDALSASSRIVDQVNQLLGS